MVELLEKERQDLLTALEHLERSNKELKEILIEEGPEVEYKEAIGDNIVAIAKKRSRLAYIEKELGIIQGNNQQYSIDTQQNKQEQSAPQQQSESMDVDEQQQDKQNNIEINDQNQSNQQNGGTWL
eukprot:TRINITY_DN20132_c0_g1_i1.p3 TRINITY_DN20132_c0_g1~~TRINITY_DN20132_c0_g1_i1.p3  ORF type:complete len:126 (-),score=27.22 TRINITY_DN20132_c0_g1_i1:163-540(-)